MATNKFCHGSRSGWPVVSAVVAPITPKMFKGDDTFQDSKFPVPRAHTFFLQEWFSTPDTYRNLQDHGAKSSDFWKSLNFIYRILPCLDLNAPRALQCCCVATVGQRG